MSDVGTPGYKLEMNRVLDSSALDSGSLGSEGWNTRTGDGGEGHARAKFAEWEDGILS